MINGKFFYLTEEQIQAHLDKEDYIKKAEEEAKRLAMTKTKVIKIVQEEAEKIGIYPKKVTSAKAGEKFKKNEDAEMQVHKRNNDKRNFNAHNLFKFADFGITELDELGVPFVNNMVIKNLSMRSSLLMCLVIKPSKDGMIFTSLKLKKLIVEHPDQEKLQYKKVKLEAVGMPPPTATPSSSNSMPPPPTPSSSNTKPPPPTPSTSNIMPPPPTPSTLNTMPPPGLNTSTSSNTLPSHATFASMGTNKGNEHQFKMDMEALYEMDREQITNEEDNQFWEDCAREFDQVEEHMA
nr:hypothetical protein [Tanacetum cinerariifolium]